jgi:hypothetical protein
MSTKINYTHPQVALRRLALSLTSAQLTVRFKDKPPRPCARFHSVSSVGPRCVRAHTIELGRAGRDRGMERACGRGATGKGFSLSRTSNAAIWSLGLLDLQPSQFRHVWHRTQWSNTVSFPFCYKHGLQFPIVALLNQGLYLSQ